MTDETKQETPTGEGPEHTELLKQAASQTFDESCEASLRDYKKDAPEETDPIICIILTIDGDVRWSGFLGLAAETAQKIAKKFAGFEIEFDSEDMDDVIAEFGNLFGSRLAAICEEEGLEAGVATPKAYRASNIEAFLKEASPNQYTCYKSRFGKVYTGILAA